jgi:hypothetical protein
LRSSLARPFWLIVGRCISGLEVFTIGSYVLPVFSFKEEAEMFLRFGKFSDEWYIRKSTCGELASVLYGPCRNVGHVALDLLPEIVAEKMVEPVSLNWEAFVKALLPSDTSSAVEGAHLLGVGSYSDSQKH